MPYLTELRYMPVQAYVPEEDAHKVIYKEMTGVL
jgi:hypothetical protein